MRDPHDELNDAMETIGELTARLEQAWDEHEEAREYRERLKELLKRGHDIVDDYWRGGIPTDVLTWLLDVSAVLG